ncbi:MAG TPA: lytic transglycosylase domain-containing protein, partial [Acetobacteraceae bacterium]|nr:lytic transglycosylase domain-containing protein [Acetobacteraceae bacterium]
IREVMNVESGGNEYLDGAPITSPAGAMGLMQVMPDTYQELESEYGLGGDPYDPRDNIYAGTAYLREMYDLFGSPGFLAAYNAGPARYEEYLSDHVPLPYETDHYVAMLAPRIRGALPEGPGGGTAYGGTAYAMNAAPVPVTPAPVPRPVAPRPVAPMPAPPPPPVPQPQPVRVAQLYEPPRPISPPPQRVASLPPPPPRPAGGFHLITPALADTPPPQTTGSLRGPWAIQVGAFDRMDAAHSALNTALHQAPSILRVAWPTVMSVRESNMMLYRARLVGLSRSAAVQACEALGHEHTACFVVSPAAQS